MRKPGAGQVGLVAVAAFCVLSLALPYWYGREADRWLQEKGRSWSPFPEMLSLEGQKNPLAYALYQSRFLAGRGIETNSDTEQTRQQLLERTEALAEAGALSKYTAEQAYEILASTKAETSSKNENGFISATYWAVDEENGTSDVVRASWQENTGLVTFYSVTAGEVRGNLEEYLEAYKIYLGVETLPDWTKDSGTEQSEHSWSQAGQLYLYCQQENGSTMLGVTSQNLETQEAAS